MGTLKRFFIYGAVNLAVILTISVLLNVLGFQPYLRANGIHYGGLLVFCALFGFIGSFVSLQLSRWMAKRALGVYLVDPRAPKGEAEAFLVEKIQGLCQGAGLATLPEIGIYPSEEVNAFATGPSRDRALVAVSTGLLDRMDAQAVEGVLGHEISHIANGDMVTMALVQGVVNTFVMFFARIIAMAIDNFLRGDEEGGGLGFFAYIIVVMLLESVLMLLASPIIYAFSRWREYRADAGSAKIAGTATMVHALKSLNECKDLVDNRQAALATMKINGRARGLVALLYSSHPRLEDRIAALQKS
jgi:heat shock protein HtpX